MIQYEVHSAQRYSTEIGNEYSTEEIGEQCMGCEHLDLQSEQGSDWLFRIKCKENHEPYIKFSSKIKGDTLEITTSYCKYRKERAEKRG